MTIKTDYILKALHILSWVLFAGLCIESTGFITSTVATLALGPDGAARFWHQIDLNAVYHFNQSQYVTLTILIIITSVLKTLMFLVIIMVFYSKNFSLSKPFNETTERFVLNLGYLSLGIGFFSAWGSKVADALAQQGVDMPDIRVLRLAGVDVWLFMGIVLLIVAFMFKKGIEMQKENDLTV